MEARHPILVPNSLSLHEAVCSRNPFHHLQIMKTSAQRLRLTLNSHTASELSDLIIRHLNTVLTHTEHENDPELVALCKILSLLRDESDYIGSELWKTWYRAFDDLLFNGNLQKHTMPEITAEDLFVEIQPCWTSETNYSHGVLDRINSRPDLVGDMMKRRQEVLKDLVLHRMGHVIFQLYSCLEGHCVLSKVPMDGEDATDHELARTLQAIEDHIARNDVLAEALGLELRTDVDETSGSEDGSDIAWDDAWYKD